MPHEQTTARSRENARESGVLGTSFREFSLVYRSVNDTGAVT